MPTKKTTEPLEANLLAQAISALGIDVPIMHVEQDATGKLTFFLYGGRSATWSPSTKSQAQSRKPAKSRKVTA